MRLPARCHFLASCCIAAMEEMILTLEKLALKHGQSMQLSILLRRWNMSVAPASGGFNAASRRIASANTEIHLFQRFTAIEVCRRFRAGRPKQPAGRGCYQFN